MDFPKLSAEQRSLLEQATTKYQAALEGSPAISYLEGRGITKEAANGFRLGYVSEPETGHEHVAGRIAIPYLTPAGVVGIKFRLLPGLDGEKYLNAGGSSHHIYNVRDLHRPEPFVAIWEGEIDALVVSGMCGIPSVGIPGAQSWKPYFRYCFQDYESVFVCGDPDDAGRELAKKIKAELNNAVVISLTDGDANETYLARGRDHIRKALGL